MLSLTICKGDKHTYLWTDYSYGCLTMEWSRNNDPLIPHENNKSKAILYSKGSTDISATTKTSKIEALGFVSCPYLTILFANVKSRSFTIIWILINLIMHWSITTVIMIWYICIVCWNLAWISWLKSLFTKFAEIIRSNLLSSHRQH